MTRVRLILGAFLLAAAGCSSRADNPTAGSTTPGAAPAPATMSPAASPTGGFEQRALAWGRSFAQCARDHGITNFPDPIYHPDWEDGAGIDFPISDKMILV